MNCWDIDGVTVSEVATVKLIINSIEIIGTGTKQGRSFQYKATQGPIGWNIGVTVKSGYLGSVQGNGWNLPQEVAYAAKHFAHV